MENYVNLLVSINFEVVLIAVAVTLGITALLGVGLAVASKFLKVEQDERIGKIAELLPGYNCGACGKAGCAAFAEAIVEGEVQSISGCKVIKPDQKAVLKEYIDNAPGPDGSKINIKL